MGPSVASEAPPPPGLLRKALPKPPVAWFPSRSRKLLPRLVTVEPAETSELMKLGVGTGVGEGVGVGVGGGVGLGDWACADDATPTASMTAKTTVMALASLRPDPVSLDRESRDEQHINAIPKRSASSTNTHKIRFAGADLPPVLLRGQPASVR